MIEICNNDVHLRIFTTATEVEPLVSTANQVSIRYLLVTYCMQWGTNSKHSQSCLVCKKVLHTMYWALCISTVSNRREVCSTCSQLHIASDVYQFIFSASSINYKRLRIKLNRSCIFFHCNIIGDSQTIKVCFLCASERKQSKDLALKVYCEEHNKTGNFKLCMC